MSTEKKLKKKQHNNKINHLWHSFFPLLFFFFFFFFLSSFSYILVVQFTYIIIILSTNAQNKEMKKELTNNIALVKWKEEKKNGKKMNRKIFFSFLSDYLPFFLPNINRHTLSQFDTISHFWIKKKAKKFFFSILFLMVHWLYDPFWLDILFFFSFCCLNFLTDKKYVK